MKKTIEDLQKLHEKMLKAMKEQQKQANRLELAIVRSNGQIPRAFKKRDN